MLDLAILRGTVIDGTGRPGQKADVGIKGDRIARVGQIGKGEAAHEIQAAGAVVCPGFIDTHCHSDIMALAEPELLPKLMQGITTELLGQDGIGAAPMRQDMVSRWRQYMSGLSGDPPVSWDWSSIGQYMERLAAAHTGPNLAILAPQGNVRMVVIGMDNIPADEARLRAMEDEVRKAMEEGAVGISLGMIYMPCTFSSREELVRLFRVSGRMGGFLVVHVRSGGDRLLESNEEVIAMAREADIPLHISHFKASGRRNWHKMAPALEAVDRAQCEGLDITFDIYPYTAGSTMFLAVLPPWVLEGGVQETLRRLAEPALRDRVRGQILNPPPPKPEGPAWENYAHIVGWENIVISSVESQKNHAWVGRSVAEIAGEQGKDPSETAFDILLEEEGRVGMIIFNMDEENVAMGLRHRLGMICTDGLLGGRPHPRVYGTFPRVLGRYVRQRKDLSLEEAVRKMTSLPARRLGLKDRGVLAEGTAADLVVFDPETVLDRATYENPRQYPAGIQHVIVNGVHSVKNGQFTGKRGGRVFKKGNL
ncbi:MAG: D-aminoacylase [Deltaproteobacteria bacterium]|nr:D-aminoacylase [Deltaproteobacteria bacterium]